MCFQQPVQRCLIVKINVLHLSATPAESLALVQVICDCCIQHIS